MKILKKFQKYKILKNKNFLIPQKFERTEQLNPMESNFKICEELSIYVWEFNYWKNRTKIEKKQENDGK